MEVFITENVKSSVRGSLVPIYIQLLAKPDETLISHSLKTGWVAETLLCKSVFVSVRDLIADLTGQSAEAVVRAISSYASMHDIGKAHWVFQTSVDQNGSVIELLKTAGYLPDTIPAGRKIRHELYSEKLLRRSKMVSGTAAEIISHHHQNKEISELVDGRPLSEAEKVLINKWEECLVMPLMKQIETEFPKENIIFDEHEGILYLMIQGVIIITDWIASGKYFSDITDSMFNTTEEFKTAVQKRTLKLIDEAGLRPLPVKDSYSYEDLFPFMKNGTIRPMQAAAAKALKEHPGYSLILIEGETGSGKTAAGQYVLLNSLAGRKKSGYYHAAPTGAIAESMMDATNAMAETAGFSEAVVKLHTGGAWMSETHDRDKQAFIMPGTMKLLNPIGCGTVDQLMAAAQKIRYFQMKIVALAAKGVLFDEVHSYDLFMETLNESLYMIMRKMNTPVVMLSATLTDIAKARLFKAFGCNDPCFLPGYPLISVIEDGVLYQYEADKCGTGKVFAPEIKTFDFQNMNGIDDLADGIVKNGGCLGIIMNRVAHANEIMKKLREKYRNDPDIKLFLIHARMPQKKREILSKEILYLFGKQGKKDGNRPQKAIVVASPILGQAMDSDFDFMITALAPIDELIQRDGRRSRHDDRGTVRERGLRSRLIVLCQEDVNEQNSRPYNHVLLAETYNYLQEHSVIQIPEELRPSMNAVYDKAQKAIKQQGRRKEEYAWLLRLPDLDDEDFMYDRTWEERRSPVTRDIELPTAELAIIPDDLDLSMMTREDCISLRYEKAVKVYEYEIKNVTGLISGEDNDSIPGYLSGITMIREKDAKAQGIRLDDIYGMIIGKE